MTAQEHLALAKRHLERVQGAWDAPSDWFDLSLYGFYCLENAVSAAAVHATIPVAKTHPARAAAARELATRCGLPDVSSLLIKLNDARKSAAYGDIARPTLDAEDVAIEIERFVDAVESFLAN